jgi:lysophospholipase L1-like esterase
MSKPATRKLLALSLVVNAVAAVGMIRTIQARGGWDYLRNRLAGAPERHGINPDAANYAQRESLFELLPKPNNRIVFAGDSLTQGCEWGEFYPGALNRGIGGDTSAGMMKRIGTITELNPRAVFLMIGSNDLFNLGLSPRQTIENIRAAVAEIHRASPQVPVYLESNLPTWEVRKNIHGRAVNEGLKSLADGKTVVYVDMYRAFLDRDILSPKLTSDGGHLNGDGYLLWKRAIDPYMSQLSQ